MRSVSGSQLGVLTMIIMAAAACTGIIGNTSNGPGSDGAPNGSAPGSSPGIDASATVDPSAAGPAVLRHLTQFEYLNTVRDLLSDTTLTPSQVPAEAPLSGFVSGFPVPGLVDVTTATAFQAAAEQLAKNASGKIGTILPCSTSASTLSSQQSCLTTFFNSFGLQAYRRPLTATEVTDLTSLYQVGLTTLKLTFSGAIDLLIEEMLQSPGFLYHWEVGPSPSVYLSDGPTQILQLDGYAMANRLSYFLWGSMPDATLLTAAAANQLSTDAQVSAQATRMLGDPKARSMVANFFLQWLDVSQLGGAPKDTTAYPEWSPTVAAEATTEFTNLVTGVVFDGTGKLPELFTTTSTQLNSDLANLYGVSGITGTQYHPVQLPASQRSGLLTTIAWLAVNGDPDTDNPVYRGHSIATQFLCESIGAPPPNVPPPASAATGGTTRSRFDAHAQQGCAVGCHSLMDPWGDAFENYGGIGEWRTTDNGLPVNSQTAVSFDGDNCWQTPPASSCQSVNGAIELSAALAQNPAVHDCFATEWFWYALGRAPAQGDAYSLDGAVTAFANSQLSIKDLLLAVADSRTFRFRTPSPGEILP